MHTYIDPLLNTLFQSSKTYKPSFWGKETSVPFQFEGFEGSLAAEAHPKQQLSQPKLPSQARSKSALQLQLADTRRSSKSSLRLVTDPSSTAGGSC